VARRERSRATKDRIHARHGGRGGIFSRSGFAALFFGAPVRARTDAWPVLQQPSIERDQATALPPVFRLSDRVISQ